MAVTSSPQEPHLTGGLWCGCNEPSARHRAAPPGARSGQRALRGPRQPGAVLPALPPGHPRARRPRTGGGAGHPRRTGGRGGGRAGRRRGSGRGTPGRMHPRRPVATVDALVVDQTGTLTSHRRGSSALAMLERHGLAELPLWWACRPTDVPVTNQRIVRPLRIWSGAGPDVEALDAIAARRAEPLRALEGPAAAPRAARGATRRLGHGPARAAKQRVIHMENVEQTRLCLHTRTYVRDHGRSSAGPTPPRAPATARGRRRTGLPHHPHPPTPALTPQGGAAPARHASTLGPPPPRRSDVDRARPRRSDVDANCSRLLRPPKHPHRRP